jgi:hypothetical protein
MQVRGNSPGRHLSSITAFEDYYKETVRQICQTIHIAK